jgi:hypothetical protein
VLDVVQRTLAVWVLLVGPFIVLATWLRLQGDLTTQFVAAYWFAPVVLTAMGVLPPPWGPLVG